MNKFIFPEAIKDMCSSTRTMSNNVDKNRIQIDFEQVMKDVHIFYTDITEDKTSLDSFNAPTYKDAEYVLKNTSMPYQVCYVEQTEDKTYLFKTKAGVILHCLCALFIERSPTEITACLLVNNEENKESKIVWINLNLKTLSDFENKYNESYSDLGFVYPLIAISVLYCFCETVHNAKSIAYENIRKSIKFKIGTHKFTKRIGNVIHLQNKISKYPQSQGITRLIEWSKAWFVRGHWRSKPGGIGKDRSGNYIIEGYTWVTHHKRGNELCEPEQRIYVTD